MDSAPSSPTLRTLGGAFFRRRPLIVSGAAVVLLAALLQDGVPRSQLLVVGAGLLAAIATFLWEARNAEAIAQSPARLRASLLRTTAFLTLACIGTGSLQSPLLPLLLAPYVALLVVLHPAAGRGSVLVAFGASAAILGVASALRPFPPLPTSAHGVAAGAALLSAALLLQSLLSGHAQESERLASELTKAREALLEETRTKAAALEQVGARLAHELRNPLSAIKGLVELEAAQSASERSSRRLEVVKSEVARMDARVGEYLAFTRSGAPLRRASVPLSRVLFELQVLLEPKAAAAGVSLAVDCTWTGTVSVDLARLKEALVNLMLNALEATPAGGQVSLVALPQPGAVSVQVKDNGKGVAPEVLAHLGTPFLTTRAGGTGLGVAIARSAAELHGGRLTYESAVGAGTVATLWLPNP